MTDPILLRATGVTKSYAGVQALAYIPRVKSSARLAYEAVARDSGFTDFYFKERAPDGGFVPVTMYT